MVDSLWGEEFKIEDTPEKTKQLIKKINSEKTTATVLDAEKAVKSRKLSVDDKLIIVKQKVLDTLGKQVDNVIVLKEKRDLHEYLNKGLSFKRIAIDTETNNSLDPITCKLMGLCLYVKGEKQAYIPVNHINKETGERLPNQLTEQDIYDELQWLIDSKGDCKFIFHNGKFDYEVLKCTCNIEVPIDWDTMIGAKLLDENEQTAGLKWQYINKIDPEQSKYSIENLFEHLPYEIVDPELFALYAATDAMMTDRLYEWQMNAFKNPELKNVFALALNLEMPLVQVIAEMELAGIEIDLDYSKRLSIKYHEKLTEVDNEISETLKSLKPKIDEWRLSAEANKKIKTATGKLGKSKSEQLDDNINLASPTQLAILFYDILKAPSVNREKPRATGESELKLLSQKLNLPIFTLLLERRELVKLITTYIDTIPEICQSWPDHRVRTHFKQYGAATGRLSSSEPINFQNIPSKNKEIRLMFHSKNETKLLEGSDEFNVYESDLVETPNGYVVGRYLKVNDEIIIDSNKTVLIKCVKPIENNHIIIKCCTDNDCKHTLSIKRHYKIIGSDFSAQEPRLTAFYTQDESMIKAYQEGRDLYSVIASISFGYPYEDCLEFYPEGTRIKAGNEEIVCGYKTHKNEAGKDRRTQAKSVLLGLIYGRGAASIAEQLHKTREEAQEIIDKFFTAFPAVKRWIDETINNARINGYVEDVVGRRRRLPDILLPKYTFKDLSQDDDSGFNPLLVCEDREVKNEKIDLYREELKKVRSRKQVEEIKENAFKNHILIQDNTSYIAQAERQAVNARVQGGASTLTKKALLDIFNNKRLKEMGAYLISTVHDEILIEAPEEYSEECSKLLTSIMINSAKSIVTNVPMSCDAYIVDRWYEDEYEALVQDEFTQLSKEFGETEEGKFQALCIILKDRSETTEDKIKKIIQPLWPEGVEKASNRLYNI